MMKSLIKLSPLESSMSVIKLILGSSECFNYNNKDYSSFFILLLLLILCIMQNKYFPLEPEVEQVVKETE